eukprot:767596-Hanusia_phi.AAC.1
MANTPATLTHSSTWSTASEGRTLRASRKRARVGALASPSRHEHRVGRALGAGHAHAPRFVESNVARPSAELVDVAGVARLPTFTHNANTIFQVEPWLADPPAGLRRFCQVGRVHGVGRDRVVAGHARQTQQHVGRRHVRDHQTRFALVHIEFGQCRSHPIGHHVNGREVGVLQADGDAQGVVGKEGDLEDEVGLPRETRRRRGPLEPHHVAVHPALFHPGSNDQLG